MPALSSLRKSRQDQEGTAGLDSAGVSALAGAGVDVYSTLDSLPMSDLTAGAKALVIEVSRLYLTDGNGWYNVQMSGGLTPYWDSGGEPDAEYTISDSATPLIITARAADSDTANLINQSFGSDSAQYMASVSNDSSVFTFTPKSADSIGIEVGAGNLTDSNGDFIYTFKWSDGINFVSKAVTITYNPSFSSPTFWGGDRGLYGGSSGRREFISYVDITTTNNTSDFGDLTKGRGYTSAAGNGTRAFWFGGQTGTLVADDNTIDYVTVATTGNATDAGELDYYTYGASATCNLDRAVLWGGYQYDLGDGNGAGTVDTIQYLNPDTANGTSDFGNISAGDNRYGSGMNDATRSLNNGGDKGTQTQSSGTPYPGNAIHYVTIATTGNSTSFGNLQGNYRESSATSDETRGVIMGGYVSSSTDDIQYVTIQSPGNAATFGNLTHSTYNRYTDRACSNNSVAYMFGTGSDAQTNNVFTIQTLGNATTAGSITETQQNYGSAAAGAA